MTFICLPSYLDIYLEIDKREEDKKTNLYDKICTEQHCIEKKPHQETHVLKCINCILWWC
jgi:hypothetical protein